VSLRQIARCRRPRVHSGKCPLRSFLPRRSPAFRKSRASGTRKLPSGYLSLIWSFGEAKLEIAFPGVCDGTGELELSGKQGWTWANVAAGFHAGGHYVCTFNLGAGISPGRRKDSGGTSTEAGRRHGGAT